MVACTGENKDRGSVSNSGESASQSLSNSDSGKESLSELVSDSITDSQPESESIKESERESQSESTTDSEEERESGSDSTGEEEKKDTFSTADRGGDEGASLPYFIQIEGNIKYSVAGEIPLKISVGHLLDLEKGTVIIGEDALPASEAREKYEFFVIAVYDGGAEDTICSIDYLTSDYKVQIIPAEQDLPDRSNEKVFKSSVTYNVILENMTKEYGRVDFYIVAVNRETQTQEVIANNFVYYGKTEDSVYWGLTHSPHYTSEDEGIIESVW